MFDSFLISLEVSHSSIVCFFCSKLPFQTNMNDLIHITVKLCSNKLDRGRQTLRHLGKFSQLS